MGRPQEFDTEAAIDAVLAVFWNRGLHRTSIDDLVAATGVARSSLYNTFGGKQTLFEHAVQRYVDHQTSALRNLLNASTLDQALNSLFLTAVTDNHEGRGCLLVNCASSLLQADEDEQPLLRRGFERMFALVEERIRKSQDANELARSVDPTTAATLVCATLSGLRVFHKAGMEKNRLRAVADLAVRTLVPELQ